MVPGSGWETMQWLQFQVANKAKYQTPSAISQKKGNLYPPKKPWPFMTQLHLDTPFLGGQLLQPSRLLGFNMWFPNVPVKSPGYVSYPHTFILKTR